MTDGTQLATAMLAVTFSVAILVSSQLFLGYRSTKNIASVAMFDLLPALTRLPLNEQPLLSGSGRLMAGDPTQRGLDADADEALEAGRSMPSSPEKFEALKKAGLLRKAADAAGLSFAKRGRPLK